jgi:poly(A) polymerase
VTAIAGGRPYEVTTLRRDVETDGRRAVVAYTADWGEDAGRRDFRLNALYMDADGLISDPTGAGVQDALAGRIVFVGDPGTRIREDYLRILRFFRFRAWFGQGPPDPAGLAACAALKEGLLRLSAERVSKELLKLLAAEDPRQAVGEMDRAGALVTILPEARPLDRLDALVGIERSLGQTDAELRLAALLPGDPEAAGAAAQRLRLSNAQRERLEAAVPSDPAIGPEMTPAEARRRLYVLGARAFEDRLLLTWAERGGDGGEGAGGAARGARGDRPTGLGGARGGGGRGGVSGAGQRGGGATEGLGAVRGLGGVCGEDVVEDAADRQAYRRDRGVGTHVRFPS